MPFELKNAPATFQAIMNDIFQSFLWKFVLVFFDDILIYSPEMTIHLNHLEQVFKVLQQHQLAAKLSKCCFGQTKVEYLGHLITEKGMQTEPSKIESIITWPRPENLNVLTDSTENLSRGMEL